MPILEERPFHHQDGCAEIKTVKGPLSSGHAPRISGGASVSVECEVKEMKTKMHQMEDRVEKIEKLDQLEKALAEERRSTKSLREEFKDAEDRTQKLEQQVESERSAATQSAMQRDEMEKKIAQLESELLERTEQVDGLKAEKEKMDRIQQDHNCKVENYIEQMIAAHNQKIDTIQINESQIKELTAQLKDEKSQKDSLTAGRRSDTRQMKELREQLSNAEVRVNEERVRNDELSKEKEKATRNARNALSNVKTLEEQKRDCERERTVVTDRQQQLETELARAQERYLEAQRNIEEVQGSKDNAVSQALRTRSAEFAQLETKVLETERKNEDLRSEAQQARTDQLRAQQLLEERQHDVQVHTSQVQHLQRELERRDREDGDRRRRNHEEQDKENTRLQQTVNTQKTFIWELESQLKQVSQAQALLDPSEAARILKVREDTMTAENIKLNYQLCELTAQLEHQDKPEPQHMMLSA